MTPGGPYLAPGARAGYRYGDSALVDPTAHDALFCSVDMRGMGAATDFYNKAKDIGRAEQDEYAAMSHDRAATAAKNALLDDEIVAVEVPQRRGDPLQVSQDDGVRPATTAESLGKLRPAFAPDGTVTAGSASRTSELAKRALRKSGSELGFLRGRSGREGAIARRGVRRRKAVRPAEHPHGPAAR